MDDLGSGRGESEEGGFFGGMMLLLIEFIVMLEGNGVWRLRVDEVCW